MRRLRRFMIIVNGLVLVGTIGLEISGYSLALWLFGCEWGYGVTERAFVAYYLLFYGVPALNLVALLTNKEKPVKPTAGVKIFPDNPI